jgi:thiamine monophosphate kinase
MDEKQFVAWLKNKFPFRRGLGIGDDASVVRLGGTFQLISTDILVEDPFPLGDAPLAARKSPA